MSKKNLLEVFQNSLVKILLGHRRIEFETFGFKNSIKFKKLAKKKKCLIKKADGKDRVKWESHNKGQKLS